MPYKPSKQTSPGLILTLAGLLVVVLLLLTYLVVTGLTALVICSFNLDYNVWAAGLGVWAILTLLNFAFRR